jgi:hypothetical protein
MIVRRRFWLVLFSLSGEAASAALCRGIARFCDLQHMIRSSRSVSQNPPSWGITCHAYGSLSSGAQIAE